MSDWGGNVAGESMSEDGVAIASHVSSNEAWSYHDMIASGWKDGYYKSVYPDGYEIVWLGSNPESSEEWKTAFALNKARHEGVAPWRQDVRSTVCSNATAPAHGRYGETFGNKRFDYRRLTQVKDPTPAPIYCVLFPAIVEAGRKVGYAITVHGSLQRDMDLVAVPWTNEAVEAKALVDAVMEACTGYLEEPRNGRDPMLKPHGRLAWSIHIDTGAYIDLSVMPRYE